MKLNYIHQGNSLEILKTFPDNSIDTVITDPPYGLSNHSENVIRDVLSHWLQGDEGYMPKTKGFMGKSWDAFVPPPALWKEVYRVMKPGATALVFAGSRTQDLMAMSMRLAGFELKDTLMWLYGSGFPKSYNISKGIDKKFGKKPKVIGKRTDGRYAYNFQKTNNPMGQLNPTKSNVGKIGLITAPATPQAKQWQGYGTALKPAYEPILFAIKPNDKNYVNNALKWGVSGLNIDEARIESKPPSVPQPKFNSPTGKIYGFKTGVGRIGKMSNNSKGRFPANIMFDEQAAKMLDKQSGVSKSTGGRIGKKDKSNIDFGLSGKYQKGDPGFGDKGGASRFFYVAKASKRERNMGLEKLPLKVGGGMSGTKDKSLKTGSGNERNNLVANFHPTVKPLKLMEYLVKLTKMPNDTQIYLDPFLGSGTTAMACKKLNRNWIGIELDPAYVKIAKARIKAVQRSLL